MQLDLPALEHRMARWSFASNQAKFALLPERAAGADKYGGTVAFPALERAGLYQVTVSDEAWVDVVQDGRYAKSVGSTGRRDCPGVRKSLRFHLAQAPFAVQVSGVASETVTLAVGSPE